MLTASHRAQPVEALGRSQRAGESEFGTGYVSLTPDLPQRRGDPTSYLWLQLLSQDSHNSIP